MSLRSIETDCEGEKQLEAMRDDEIMTMLILMAI